MIDPFCRYGISVVRSKTKPIADGGNGNCPLAVLPTFPMTTSSDRRGMLVRRSRPRRHSEIDRRDRTGHMMSGSASQGGASLPLIRATGSGRRQWWISTYVDGQFAASMATDGTANRSFTGRMDQDLFEQAVGTCTRCTVVRSRSAPSNV